MRSARGHAPLLLATLLFVCIGYPPASQAEMPPIPDDLAPWVDWVIYDHPQLQCPQVPSQQDDRPCEWPGKLEVRADAQGANFTLRGWLATTGDLVLPGEGELWPQQVQVDGRPAVLRDLDGRPAVRLGSGEYILSGQFFWSDLPQYISVPPEVGLVSLQLDDDYVERPRVDAEGRLWLERPERIDDGDETDRVRATIYRRFEDGIPLRIVTRIELHISGKAREIELGDVFVPGSRPISVDGPVAVNIDGDSPTIYARPGSYEIDLVAVIADPVEEIEAPETNRDFYDAQEVWVWVPDDVVRSVDLSGLSGVDPARTSLPEQWRGHATYLATAGDVLSLEVIRRGATERPNELILHRNIWLDIAGDGMTIRDELGGNLARDWRLDYGGDAELGRVHQQTDDEDLLITENIETGLSGVELRSSQLDLLADLRLESASMTLPAVGWDSDVQKLSATLHLPPGWTLLSARGVDEIRGAGILDSWTLWDFFFVLIVALSVGKLLGWRWTPVAILALALAHGHQGAPLWTWILLIATLPLLRVLPDGWWRKGVHVVRVGILLILFVVLAMFAHDQIRTALHPQIDTQMTRFAGADLAAPPAAQAPSVADDALSLEYLEEDSIDLDGDYRSRAQRSPAAPPKEQLELDQIDPNAVVQTGPGVPDWTWNSWHFDWSGPVHRDQEIRLWLISPSINRILSFLRIALLIVLALVLLSWRDMSWRKVKTHDGDGGLTFWKHLIGPAVVLVAAAIPLIALSGGTAQAQEIATPTSPSIDSPDSPRSTTGGNAKPTTDGDLLDTLRHRLVDARTCRGPCIVVSRATFTIEGSQLTMNAEVHAQMDAGWHLPGPSDELQIRSVRLDGDETTRLRREPGGLTALYIPKGRHDVEIVGRLANRNSLTLRFGDQGRPRRITYISDDWTVVRLSPGGVQNAALELTRTADFSAPIEGGADDTLELPPWFHVERRVALGLPWQLQTRITREDTSRSQSVRIPLVDGESVITDGPRVEDGLVLVEFPRGQNSVEYISELQRREQIELTAPDDQPWSETWRVRCSRIWRCNFSGLPPTEFFDDDQNYRPTFQPWPTESLIIDVARPAGVEGQSSTVDDVNYRVTLGERLLEATLELTIRSSDSGSRTIVLPEGAEVQRTQINQSQQSMRLEEQELELPIRPGEHTYTVRWQQPWEPGLVEQMPDVDIGSEATNVDLTIERRQDRWLLHTTGPSWGPAILFWPHLVMLLIIALLLNALRGLPLKLHEWILLVLGMSQLPYIALVPIVAWFAALTIRERAVAKAWWKFDILQLFLVGLTLVAMAVLYAAVHTNLLFDVDMQVSGANSSNSVLHWYVDRSTSQLGGAGVISVPILIWRGLMLLWAFWLVHRLLSWIPWGWKAFSKGGLWRWNEKDDPPSAAEVPEKTDGTAEDSDEEIEKGSS